MDKIKPPLTHEEIDEIQKKLEELDTREWTVDELKALTKAVVCQSVVLLNEAHGKLLRQGAAEEAALQLCGRVLRLQGSGEVDGEASWPLVKVLHAKSALREVEKVLSVTFLDEQLLARVRAALKEMP